jgi:hypothetical protein
MPFPASHTSRQAHAERLALTDEEKHVACCATLLHDVPAQPPLQALIQQMPFDFASG